MEKKQRTVVQREVSMNLLNLEYFIVAAEELNFTRAAKRLHIVQQSLSNHIAKLEAHFGTELFDRTPPMSLTPAGLCFLRYAKSLRNTMDDMEAEIQDIKDFKKSELTIGITPARGAVYLPMLLPKFSKAFPMIKVNLIENGSKILETMLREAKVDLVLGLLPKDPLGITSETLWKERYVLVVSNDLIETYIPEKKERLFAQPGRVDLKDFEQVPFLSIRMDLRTGTIFHSCCARAEMMPNVVMESANINIVLSLCMEGMGALVCPNEFLYPYMDERHSLRNKAVSVFPVDYSDEVAVSYLSSKYLSVGAQRFKELAKEVGRGLGKNG